MHDVLFVVLLSRTQLILALIVFTQHATPAIYSFTFTAYRPTPFLLLLFVNAF